MTPLTDLKLPPIDSAAAILCLLALVMLSTGLARVARMRHAERRHMQNLLAHIGQGVVIFGPRQRVQTLNDVARRLLDLGGGAEVGRLSLEDVQAREAERGVLLASPSDGLAWVEQQHAAPADSMREWTRSDGRILEIRSVPLPDDGQLRIYRDVTDHRQAVEDAKARTSFASTLINSSPDFISLLDLEGRVTFVSDVGQELFEIWDFEQIRGQHFTAFFPVEHRARAELALRRVRAGQTDRFTRMCPTMMGIQRWWEFILSPVQAVGGASEQLFVVARDITDRQAQAEELGRTKEAAERASRAKSQFLATMSHEIRTPLNAILGFAALAQKAPQIAPDLTRQLALIEKAGHSLLTTINDVLDFSKIEAGKLELEQRPLELRKLAEDCLSLTRWLAEEKGLQLECTIDPDVPALVVADEARVRQVLLNLLNNAVKFTPAGRVGLQIRGNRDMHHLEFVVEDSGIGISPERIGSLFEDFVQGDGSISRQYGGTGLGLSISRRLARLMGGDIRAESTLGFGSRFCFHIPVVDATKEGAAISAPASVAPRAYTPRRILLVDDLEINQEIVAAMLGSVGHDVEIATSGPQAIASYSARRHDLILMDVQMPDMDGLEATRRIREADACGRVVPIIALTANVFSQQVESYRKAGMNDHIGKPFERDALLAKIEQFAPHRDDEAGHHAAVARDIPASPAIGGRLLELKQLLGTPKTLELLARLRAELPGRFAGETHDGLREDAHAVTSSAGLLGYERLSAAARKLEAAIEAGGDVGPSLTHVLAERQAALTSIDGAIALFQADGTAMIPIA